MRIRIPERKIHRLFVISLFFKASLAIVEIIGSLFIFFISKGSIVTIISSVTQEELTEDPADFIAHYLIKTANQLSITNQHFISLYLLGHGLIKFLLVIGLLKRKFWVYPVSIFVFSILVIYQTQKYLNTHSLWLLLITIIDVSIILLTWYEYRHYNKIKKTS
jgi:uncharacterized membrane protein